MGVRLVPNARQEKNELLHQYAQVAVKENTKMNLEKAAVSLVRLESGPAHQGAHLPMTSATKGTRKTETVVFLAHY